MNLETIRKDCAVLVRKAQEMDTEYWLKRGLPKGHGLPAPAVMAAQVVALKEILLALLRAQQERYAAYVEENPPQLAPVAKTAMAHLPPEAALTYHFWLEGVTVRREWWDDATRSFRVDQLELSAALRDSLQEAVGTGGVAARRASGALPPGFASLSQTQAKALLREIAAYAKASSPEAWAIYQAVADRASASAIRAAVLRDGAGRLVGAVSYRTAGDLLDVGHLGALDGQVPGTGVQMLRELAAAAAREGKGVLLQAPIEARPFFSGLEFAPDAEGGLRLAVRSASELAQGIPATAPGWVRVGWLEGRAGDYSLVRQAEVGRLVDDLYKQWADAKGSDAYTMATQALDDQGVGPSMVERGSLEQAFVDRTKLGVLREKDGSINGLVRYRLPEEAGEPLEGLQLAARPGSPPGTGRFLMRQAAQAATESGSGVTLHSLKPSVDGFYERIGMRPGASMWGMREYSFTPAEAAAFASGLTGTTAFGGQLTWELAVAGASDWLRQVKIPGVVDEVSQTTHQALVDALAYGLGRGEGTQELALRVRQLDKVFGPVRAERIARTEVLTANRHGGYQIGKEAGCKEHEWRARIESPRTRKWHAAAHKQRVPYAEPYTVPNRKGELQQLLYPGDRSLGAGPDNTIQCRCSERRIKPGVTDDETLGICEHDLAGTLPAPGPVTAGVKVWVTSAG